MRTLKAVGVTFDGRQGNLERAWKREEATCEPTSVRLVKEPDNPHDANAVAIVLSDCGSHVGYVKKGTRLPRWAFGQDFTAEVHPASGKYPYGLDVMLENVMGL